MIKRFLKLVLSLPLIALLVSVAVICTIFLVLAAAAFFIGAVIFIMLDEL